MIKIEKLISPKYSHENYNTFTERYSDLEEVQINDLGKSEDPEKNIYGIRHGDLENKPCIFLVGSIHGSEWESAYWTLFFMEMIANPQKAPHTLREYFRYLKDKYSFYAVPVANPWGFENMSRTNYNGVDANRDYDDKSQKEIQIITEKFSEIKPVLFFDNHLANINYHSFGTANSTCERVFYEFKKSIRLILRDNTIDFYPLGGFESSAPGTGREWASKQDNIRGTKTISVLLEGFRSLEQESYLQEKATFGINALLIFCLYVDIYLTFGIQNPLNSDIDRFVSDE